MTDTSSPNLPDRYRASSLPAADRLPVTGRTAPADLPEGMLDMRALLGMFRRRLRMFGLIVAIFVLLALNLTFAQQKLYSASADLALELHPGELVRTPGDGQAQDQAPTRSEEIETEIKQIGSHELAEAVARSLNLDKDADFLGDSPGSKGLLARLGLGGAAPPSRSPLERATTTLMGNVKAERMDNAYALTLSYTDPDPERSARIANTYVAAYTTSAVQVKRTENRQALALLSQRIDELRGQAEADFKAVQDYRVRNGLLSAQATQLSEQQAAAFAQQLASASAMAARDRGREAASGGVAAAAETSSPLLAALRSQRAAISVRVAQMSGRYLDTHPDLVNARQELADIDSQIAAETARVRAGAAGGLAADVRASARQEGAVAGGLASSRATLAANNRALVGLDDLSRKAQASQSLYESYLNRYKGLMAQIGSERPIARLLTPPAVPIRPVSPNLVLNLALGLLLGCLAGGSAAIAAESAYSGLTTRDDVERRIGVRFLGGIPQVSSLDLGEDDPLASLLSSPRSAYAEAVRGLLTSVRQSGAPRNQVIAVTSALPGEGKSVLAASLARVAAQSGHSVALVDCDLVRRTQGELFGADNQRPGLREMLRDGVPLGEAMIKDPASEAVIVPITTPFADGERLLERGSMQQMIAKMREHFGLIVLDCAPILPVAEVRELVTLADNVVVCAAWRDTPDTAVRAALQMLPAHAIADLGVALTRIDMKKQARFGAGDPGFHYARYKHYYVQHQPA